MRVASVFVSATVAIAFACVAPVAARTPAQGASVPVQAPAPASVSAPTPLTADELFIRGTQLLQSGDTVGAIEAYEALLERAPDRVDARSNLGAAYVRLGRYDQAIEQYQAALTRVPEETAAHAQIRFNLALALYKAARIPEAQAELQRVVARDASNQRAVLVLADCQLRMGQDAAVVALLAPREAAFGDDRLFAYLLGNALIRRNELLRGQAYIERLFRGGETAEAHLLLGAAHLQRRDSRAAIPELQRAVALNPDLPTAHALLGRAYRDSGQRDEAMAAFREELVRNANDFDAHLYLGLLLKDENQLDESYEHLTRASRLRSDDPAVLYGLGALHLAAGRVEEAEQALVRVTMAVPDYRQAHVLLATVYYRQKKKDLGDRERAIAEKLTADQQQRDLANPGAPALPDGPPATTAEDPKREPGVAVRAEPNSATNSSSAIPVDGQARRTSVSLGASDRDPESPATAGVGPSSAAEAAPRTGAKPASKPARGPARRGAGGTAAAAEFDGLAKSAVRAREEGRAGDALRDYQRALRLQPSWREGRWELARLLLGAGEPDAAFDVLRPFAAASEDVPGVIQAFGLAVLRLRDRPEDRSPERQELIMLAGRGGYHMARVRRSAAGRLAFEELVSRYPHEPNVHYAFGTYLLPEEPDAAVAEFKKELARDAAHYPSMLQIAFIDTKRGNAAQAVTMAESAVRIAPDAAPGRLVLGRALLADGQTARAIEQLERGAALAPENPSLQFALASAYQKAGRREDATRARAAFRRLEEAWR